MTENPFYACWSTQGNTLCLGHWIINYKGLPLTLPLERSEKDMGTNNIYNFMDPEDEIYRRILEAGQGFKDADNQAPLYLRTTEEMLQEFAYLGHEKAFEVVVENTNKIADMCSQISPISPEKCPPHIDGCEQTIKDIAYGKAHELYGDQ